MSTRDYWTGHHVRLRALQPDDVDVLVVQARDGRGERLGGELRPPEAPESFRRRIERSWAPDNKKLWLAIVTTDDKLAGTISVHRSDVRHRNFTYGIDVFADYRRRGVASEAIALVLRYYFRELGYHRANAAVYAFNTASLALHRRLGFVEEGRARELVYTDGAFHDEVSFGMLAGEFGPLEQLLPALPAAGG